MSALQAAAERVRTDGEPARRWAATAAGLALVVGLSAIDAAWDELIASTVVIGPFLTALFATVRQTAAVGVAAVVAVLLSGLWNDNLGDTDYWVRTLVVIAGGLFSVTAARRQERAALAEALGAQFTAALSNLAEAVVVQGEDQRILYVNEAAADALGYATADTLLTTPREELVEDADYFYEDGRRVPPEEFPSRRVLDGEDPGPVTIRIVKRATGEERWRVTKARGIADSRGRTRLVVSVVEDITEQKRAEIRQRLLARAGDVLASSIDYERTLQDVANLAVPELADWCGVSMPDRGGVIRQVAVAHTDPAKVEFARDYNRRYPQYTSDEGGAAQTLRDGQPQLVADIPDELLEQAVEDLEQRELLRSIGMRSVIVVPMAPHGGTPTGVLSFVNAESGRVFTEADLELCVELGRRAGIAVENARLYTERSRIARTLQRALLPPALPEMPGFSVAALYRPAGRENWVGGDFYDAFRVKSGWMVVVGDVAGRGAQAASLTAFSRHVFRTSAQLLDDPLDAVAFLNRQLYERPGSALCTVCCVLLRERGEDAGATVICAGHPQPYVVRRGGRAEAVGRWGQMLGAWKRGGFPRTETTLEPDQLLVIYTDGVTDTVGESERFGDDRLRETVAAAQNPADALRRIEDALVEFEHGDQVDDTAALAIAREQVASSGDFGAQLGSAA
jgi:PAS domain S-box-containing protein